MFDGMYALEHDTVILIEMFDSFLKTLKQFELHCHSELTTCTFNETGLFENIEVSPSCHI